MRLAGLVDCRLFSSQHVYAVQTLRWPFKCGTTLTSLVLSSTGATTVGVCWEVHPWYVQPFTNLASLVQSSLGGETMRKPTVTMQ